MPFKDELDSVYSKLQSICNELNVECKRSDDAIAVGSITKGIFHEIYNSEIIIADLTYSNPNVFYEIAVSHCIGRKTILITQEDNIPFDIGQDYVIKYSNTLEGSLILEKEVKRLVKHLLDGGIIDNPAHMFLPKSIEEKKLEKLSDLSKDILITLAESRKMEIEIVSKQAFLMDEDSTSKVKKDLNNWNILIKKIKNKKSP